jgi:zinc protease
LPALADEKNMFPYPCETYRLDNGMEVVLIKYGNDGIMMDLLVVDVGVRNEKKPDEIEYTHLMEHLIFRASKNYSIDKVKDIYCKYGIYEQGFTENDFTCYYRKFPEGAFEELSSIMADKLVNLEVPNEEYKAETGAVIGEYLGGYQSPWRWLFSKLYETAYTVHPYRDVPEHLDILKKMPDNQERVMKFYHDYYKPNNCRLIIAGDFNSEKIKKIIDKYYGSLKPGNVLPEVPQEPPQEKERTALVKFAGETSPYIIISYKLPAYDINNTEIPSIDLIKELYFREGSPLYNRLVYDEKLVSSVYFPGHYFCKDPGLFSTTFKLKKAEDVEKVKGIAFEEIEKIRNYLCDPLKLNEIREKNRYKMLSKIDSMDEVAFTFLHFYVLSHNTDGMNIYFKNYFKIKPEDLKEVAKKYFIEKNRTVVTLIEKGKEPK